MTKIKLDYRRGS